MRYLSLLFRVSCESYTIYTLPYIAIKLTMVDPVMEKPLPSLSCCCSHTFWDEDASGIPASDLFHFTADVNGINVAITLDKGTRYNFVSSEVVEQLQLVPKTTNPIRLPTNDDELIITHIVFVPLTIHGHKERILCYVLPRAAL